MLNFFFLTLFLFFANAYTEDFLTCSVGQTIYHNNRSFIVTSYEHSQFPFEGEKEYFETIITAERQIMLLGIEFAKDLLRIVNKQGKNPNTGSNIISHTTTISRSYALKSYLISIIGILSAYSLSKVWFPPGYHTYIVNKN